MLRLVCSRLHVSTLGFWKQKPPNPHYPVFTMSRILTITQLDLHFPDYTLADCDRNVSILLGGLQASGIVPGALARCRPTCMI
jgi:hypothetical protein